LTQKGMPDQRDLAAILQKRGYAGLRKIGEGSYGIALLIEDAERLKFVCKLVDISKASVTEIQETKKEARLLSQVKHPYIVRYRENFMDRGWMCIIMDYADGGDLSAQIDAATRKRTPLEERKVLHCVTQSVLALKYLHAKHILHRDLKPSNIFLTRSGDVRLGDFGMSKVMSCTGAYARTFVGTPYYVSPEVIQEKPYAWPADVWSMGCIWFQMCARRVPFEARNITELAQKILYGKIPTLPEGYSDAARTLCAQMMARKAHDRPSCDGVIDSDLIQATVRQMLKDGEDRKKEKAKEKPAEQHVEISEKTRIRHEIMDQFQMFDRNGDGVIDRTELATVLKHLDAGVWTDDMVDKVVAVADSNGDGQIQFDEFLIWAFGGKNTTGLAARADETIAKARKAVDDRDLATLGQTLLDWRKAVDVGCLRVSPPEVCIRTCQALADVISGSKDLLECHGDAQASFQAVRQCRAILLAVEQLLEECGRQHVQRIASITAEDDFVRGLCLELANGTRTGSCENGLADSTLEASGARWELLTEGERIVAVKGLTGAQDGQGGGPNEDHFSAANLTICTSHGRELEYGYQTGGDPFFFKAEEGDEIEELKFSGKTCSGIRTAPIKVNWQKSEVEAVRNVFKPAVDAVWTTLLYLAWRVGPRHGKYALLEARRLGVPDMPLPEDILERQASRLSTAVAPEHWLLALMPGAPRSGSLGPDVGVGRVHLNTNDITKLQVLLTSSFRPESIQRAGDGDGGGGTMLPVGLELVRGIRLQNWHAWIRFLTRREEIRAEVLNLRENGNLETVRDAGTAATVHLESLGIAIDSETQGAWLFHGISAKAAEDSFSEKDFDIAKADAVDGRLYGRGIYFSEWSSSVDRLFVADSASGLRCMLLCRVTLGHVLREDAVLPDVMHVVDQCTSGPHHSVLGDREERCPGSTREFVVYDKDQVYPEFLLWYKRSYK